MPRPCPASHHPAGELARLSSRQLLSLYAALLTELMNRGVTRSRNAPLGDIAEFLVAHAYEGQLAAPVEKSWDVLAPDGRRIQVKARLVQVGKRATQTYSPFRSWDFDVCVFINFDADTYDVISAVEVPPDGIRTLASPSPHVGATAARVHTRSKLLEQHGAVDVTAKLQTAMVALD